MLSPMLWDILLVIGIDYVECGVYWLQKQDSQQTPIQRKIFRQISENIA